MADELIDETRDVTSDGLIEIINTRGEVTVTGWGRDQVHVEGELDELAEEFIFEVNDDRTTIEVKIPKRDANWGSGSDLEISVPRGSRVSFESVSSDGEFSDIQGGIRVRAVSGDITATEIAGQVYIKTVSGDIEVEKSSGTANIASVSGELELELDSRRLNLDSVSGDISADLTEFESLLIDIVSGDIDVEGKLLDNGEIDITSVSSDVDVELDSPVNARVSIETGPGGDIANGLNDASVKDRFPAMHMLETTVGDGSGDINIRTVSGDINIESVD
jgi:DUF4097 and DUF4098 domain-containing protein YvlB